MNRLEKEQYLESTRLILEANEALLRQDSEAAEELYERLMHLYKDMPGETRSRIYAYALELRESILLHKTAPSAPDNSFSQQSQSGCFVMYDGRLIRDLHHLVYVLDSISELDFQYHVNATKNELLDWIRFRLKDCELADLLYDISEKEEFKKIVLRYLLLKSFRHKD